MGRHSARSWYRRATSVDPDCWTRPRSLRYSRGEAAGKSWAPILSTGSAVQMETSACTPFLPANQAGGSGLPAVDKCRMGREPVVRGREAGPQAGRCTSAHGLGSPVTHRRTYQAQRRAWWAEYGNVTHWPHYHIRTGPTSPPIPPRPGSLLICGMASPTLRSLERQRLKLRISLMEHTRTIYAADA